MRAARQQLAQAVIEPEFNRLSRAGRALLGHLVSSGGPIAFSRLAEAAQDDDGEMPDEDALDERLRQMVDAGLVEEIKGDRYGFAFPTAREWVKSRLDPGSGGDSPLMRD